MLVGAPSKDTIIARDELHRTMMENGCRSLAAAIDAYRSNTIHGFGRRDPIWLMPFEHGHRDVAPPVNDDPAWFDREPCASCGVRADRHAESGCKAYRRGRAA